jgi:membrane-bound metal-dependent hydrolase YbcI (DUF457 family)
MTDPISIALAVYVAGMALWFFIAGWSEYLDDTSTPVLATVGIIWPFATFVWFFMFAGYLAKELMRRNK